MLDTTAEEVRMLTALKESVTTRTVGTLKVASRQEDDEGVDKET